MEHVWNEISAPRLFFRDTVQAVIEGTLPSIEGRNVIEVLDRSARINLDKVVIASETVSIYGGITVNVLAIDGDNNSFSFESTAGFTHDIPAAGVENGMSAKVLPVIQSIDVHAREGEAVLYAVLDMEIRVISSIPLRVTGGVSGIPDLELKSVSHACSKVIELGSENLRMREELAEAGIIDILSTTGQIHIRDVLIEQGGASVSGVIGISSIYKDSEGVLNQLVRQIPFRERLNINAIADNVYCEASLNSISLRSLGAEFSLLSMEADVDLKIYGTQTDNITLPVDAFSPSIGFSCLREQINLLNSTGSYSSQTSLRESITVPDGLPDIEKPLFASCEAIITSQYIDNDDNFVEGLLVTKLVYESSGKRSYAFTEDVPFRISLDYISSAAASSPLFRSSAIASVASANGRSAQINYSLNVECEMHDICSTSVVVGLAECESPVSPKGILVCFTSEGEDAFDLAKRYSVPTATIRKLNPDVSEPYSEGNRLIIFN